MNLVPVTLWFEILCVPPVLFGACDILNNRAVRQPAARLASEDPLQEGLGNAPAISRYCYTITPPVNFEVRARVLFRERYRRVAGARLAPVDTGPGRGQRLHSAVLAI